MPQGLLKSLRVVVPGTFAVVVCVPMLVLLGFSKESPLKQVGDLSMVALFFGGLYYILNLRSWFFRTPIERHKAYLTERLVQIAAERSELVSVHQRSLASNSRVLQLFYNLVDNDESLKKKTQNVYFNGLIFSSVADLQTISLLGMLLYSGLSLAATAGLTSASPGSFTAVAVVCLVMFLGCHAWLLPLAERKHRQLFDEQAEYISTVLPSQLAEKIESLIKS